MRWLPLLLIAAPLAAQKPAVRLDPSSVKVDQFTKTERLSSPIARLNGTEGPATGTAHLLWGRSITAANDTTYGMSVAYLGTDWLFIPKAGTAIEFLADTQRIQFESVVEIMREQRGDVVREIAAAIATPAEMFALARANTVTWRLHGQNRHMQGVAKPSDFNNLRRFLVTVFPDSTILER